MNNTTTKTINEAQALKLFTFLTSKEFAELGDKPHVKPLRSECVRVHNTTCTHYRFKGACKFGKNCSYLHVLVMTDTMSEEEKEHYHSFKNKTYNTMDEKTYHSRLKFKQVPFNKVTKHECTLQCNPNGDLHIQRKEHDKLFGIEVDVLSCPKNTCFDCYMAGRTTRLPCGITRCERCHFEAVSKSTYVKPSGQIFHVKVDTVIRG